jgi:hypothetical protein
MKPIWPALLGANVAWAVHLVVSYYLAWAACAGDDGTLEVLRHLATAVALAVTLAALWHGVRARSTVSAAADGAGREEIAEHVFLARLTIALSVMLLLGIALAGAANLVLVPCR